MQENMKNRGKNSRRNKNLKTKERQKKETKQL